MGAALSRSADRRAEKAAAALAVFLFLRLASSRSARRLPKFGGCEAVTAPARQLEPFPVGRDLVMSFARQHFTWTEEHVPGSEIVRWESRGDGQGDAIFVRAREEEDVQPDFPDFLAELRQSKGASVEPLPDWVDEDLLQVGCDFFVATWPLVFLSLSWALVAGFGAETASAVLLESRYWAVKGAEGQRDSFQRLQETVAWLYDICGHGAAAFRPDGVAWTAALHVRWLHARTRASVAAKKDWDAAGNGVPINQAQLIGTLLGVSALLIQGMEKTLGRPFPTKQREGFIHLWRLIGHLFGIEPALNPNTSFQRAMVTMESTFAFAIPTQPNPASTAVLSVHMCESIARGLREQYGVRVPAEYFAARARFYVGDAYSDALGLPAVSRRHRFVARIFAFQMQLQYLPYVLLPLPVVHRIYDMVMRRWFEKVVRVVRWKHEQQGKTCRFGSLSGGSAQVCPLRGETSDVGKFSKRVGF